MFRNFQIFLKYTVTEKNFDAEEKMEISFVYSLAA